ncbi:unnamed protein product [Brassica rapa subsp. trilocularis]
MFLRQRAYDASYRKAVSRQLTSARHLKRLSVSICSCLISSSLSESVFNLYFL